MKAQKNSNDVQKDTIKLSESSQNDLFGIKPIEMGKVSLDASESMDNVSSNTDKTADVKKEKIKVNNSKLKELDKKSMSSYIINCEDLTVGTKEILHRKRESVIPDPSLATKLCENGQRIHEALAELIDNSLDAKTLKQKRGNENLLINIILDVNAKSFKLIDNGVGMNYDDLVKSARLGVSEKTSKQFGLFGLGQKTSLPHFGSNYIVSTSTENSDRVTQYSYNPHVDLDWERDFLQFAKSNPNFHGTMVEVPNVNNIEISDDKIEELKKIISKRYADTIKLGLAIIVFNGEVLKPVEPDWAEKYPRTFTIKFFVEKTNVWYEMPCTAGLTNESSQGGHYGVNLIRNGRVIEIHSKFGITAHSTIARFIAYVDLSFARVSHTKNKFIEDSIEYEEAAKAFANHPIVKEILAEAKKSKSYENTQKAQASADLEMVKFAPILHIILGDTKGFPKTKKDLKAYVEVTPTEAGNVELAVKKKILKTREENSVNNTSTTSNNQNKTKKESKSLYERYYSNIKPDKEYKEVVINGLAIKWDYNFYESENGEKKITKFKSGDSIIVISINMKHPDYQYRDKIKDSGRYVYELIRDTLVELKFKDREHDLIVTVNDAKDYIANKSYNIEKCWTVMERKNRNKKNLSVEESVSTTNLNENSKETKDNEQPSEGNTSIDILI